MFSRRWVSLLPLRGNLPSSRIRAADPGRTPVANSFLTHYTKQSHSLVVPCHWAADGRARRFRQLGGDGLDQRLLVVFKVNPGSRGLLPVRIMLYVYTPRLRSRGTLSWQVLDHPFEGVTTSQRAAYNSPRSPPKELAPMFPSRRREDGEW